MFTMRQASVSALDKAKRDKSCASCRSGIVTKEMLQAPDRKLFLWIGGLEAFSQLLGFIGASKLPGVVLPLLQQSLLIWQVTLAYLVLNKRLDSIQVGLLCHCHEM